MTSIVSTLLGFVLFAFALGILGADYWNHKELHPRPMWFGICVGAVALYFMVPSKTKEAFEFLISLGGKGYRAFRGTRETPTPRPPDEPS